MWWLKTTEVYTLTVLEHRSQKLGCQQGHTPSEGSRESPSLPLPTSGGPWHSLACGSMTLSSAYVAFRPATQISPSFLLGTPVIRAGCHPQSRMISCWDPELNSSSTFHLHLVSNKAHSHTGTRDKDLEIPFEGHPIWLSTPMKWVLPLFPFCRWGDWSRSQLVGGKSGRQTQVI